MAPANPTDFVERPELASVKKQMIDAEGRPVAVAIALRGSTGYGKTALARALANDPDICNAYSDGTLFAELGQKGRARILAAIADIAGQIDPERRFDFATADGARTALGELLGNRSFLLVIDDVWSRGDLQPFLHGGPNTTRLITTRFASELPKEVFQEPVAGLTGGADGQAWRMLAAGLTPDQVSANLPALVALAERLHNWPQALHLANGFLFRRMGLSRHARWDGLRLASSSLENAIAAANAGLDERGGSAFDSYRFKLSGGTDEGYEERHTSVAFAMELNLSLLDETCRTRFIELAVFPEDVDLPIGMAARLWAETGGLERSGTERLLATFDDASLLLDFDWANFRLHDSVREFLLDRAGKEGRVRLHKQLIQAIGDIGDTKDTPAAEANYFYRYVPQHLSEAQDSSTLDALLLDPAWLKAKLAVTDNPLELISDYDQYGQTKMHHSIARTLRLTSGICARDPRQLLPQLIGRLARSVDPAAPAFLKTARRHIPAPSVLTRSPSLTPPSAETARLEGHSSGVGGVEGVMAWRCFPTVASHPVRATKRCGCGTATPAQRLPALRAIPIGSGR